MLKKTLLTAAAALAITTGATAISAPDANAGGFYGHHGFSHKFHGFKKRYYGYGHRKCYVKYYKKVKIKVYAHHGYVWKWIKKPVYACHY